MTENQYFPNDKVFVNKQDLIKQRKLPNRSYDGKKSHGQKIRVNIPLNISMSESTNYNSIRDK